MTSMIGFTTGNVAVIEAKISPKLITQCNGQNDEQT